MGRITVELDHAGLAEILRTQFAKPVRALADQVAANVRAQDPTADVDVADFVTDRTVSVVRVRDGDLRQARDGVLTRAAAGAGLTVKPKRGRR